MTERIAVAPGAATATGLAAAGTHSSTTAVGYCSNSDCMPAMV